MTNHWVDIKNADAIMIIGSNAAENHPMSFKWVTEAIEKNGATLIVVDPRFTRSASKAHIYVPMRSGTDIAFIGHLINYAIQNNCYHRDYMIEHTNACFVVKDTYAFADGLFSGFNAEKKKYDSANWDYVTQDLIGADGNPVLGADGNPLKVPVEDKTLQNPRCVFNLMKDFYSRYDRQTVSKITGTPPDLLDAAANAFCATGAPGKSGTILYAMGTTQHTYGSQNVRSYAELQLLLGNMGLAGGGINALRGESNVQGSTDMALLFHLLPGYLKVPRSSHIDLTTYLDKNTPKSNDPKSLNYWKNTPKFMKSMLKAWFGEHATTESDFCYGLLPKVDDAGNHSHISLFEDMLAGKIKGLIAMGQNPAVGGPNSDRERAALDKLEWLVVSDLWVTETATFWKRPGKTPANINTEVFFLPAASSVEKEGSIANSGRWVQWRYKAVEPPGDAKSDMYMIDELMKRMKADPPDMFPDPIVKVTWDYGDDEEEMPHKVAKEYNGYVVEDYIFDEGKPTEVRYTAGQQLKSFGHLRDDGKTACGNWIYCQSYVGEGPGADKGNNMARRDPTDTSTISLYPTWAWCWPLNRRIIYNRASCDTAGRPWDPQHKVIWWDSAREKWVGDVPDFGPTSKPEGGVHAFIMVPEGHGKLFGKGMLDGPFAEHYEPMESPVSNLLHPSQSTNPAVYLYKDETGQPFRFALPDAYPIIGTTYRLTEHWQAGAMTRNLPWLCELQPNVFVEMSKEFAEQEGISLGDRVVIESIRGSMEAVAIVTERFKPFVLYGKTVHQVGIPWHWGYEGAATGDSANVLTPHVGDVNTRIPEYKAFLCKVRKA